MNSLDRVLATVGGESVDRRAVSLTASLYGAKLTRCPLEKYYTDPNAYAEGQSAIKTTFQPDILFGPFSHPLEGAVFGSKVKFYDSQAPNLAKPVITSVKEITNVNPPEIEDNEILQFFHNAIKLMAAQHGKDTAIAAISLNPVDLPIMIMRIDNWLNTVLFNETGVKQMMEITVPYFVKRVNALFEAGAHLIVMPSAFSNPSIVTRDIIKNMALPVLRDAFGQVKGPLIIHSGGAPLAPFLDLLKDLPNVIGFVLNSSESFRLARDKAGPEKVLIGNIDGPTLGKKNRDDVKTECINALKETKNDPHIILGSSAADISFDTTVENIHVFRQAAEQFSHGESF